MQKRAPFPAHLSAKGAKVVTLLCAREFRCRSPRKSEKRRWQNGEPPLPGVTRTKKGKLSVNLCGRLNCETFLASPNGAEGGGAIKKIIQLFWGAFVREAFLSLSCFWWTILFAAKTRSHVTWWSRPAARRNCFVLTQGIIFGVICTCFSPESVAPKLQTSASPPRNYLFWSHFHTTVSRVRRIKGCCYERGAKLWI